MNYLSNTVSKKTRVKIRLVSIAFLLALIMIASALLSACVAVDIPFAAPESRLPTEELFALNKYKYEDLTDVQPTLRSDVLTVTERNVKRDVPEELSGEFSLIYDTADNTLSAAYGSYSKTAAQRVASVDFTRYPSPSGGINANMFADAANAAGKSVGDYFNYYKYMLMTQGQHLAKEASARSARSWRALNDSTPRSSENSLTGWLKKHPSADAQYGRVLGENNAVEKVITLDPLYRSPHATGLYLPAGEVVTVKVEGLAEGERLAITLGDQNTLAWRGGVSAEGLNAIKRETQKNWNELTYKDSASDYFFKQADVLTALGKFYDYNTSDNAPFIQSQYKRQNARAPWLSADFTFDKNGEYEIGFAFGGLIQLSPGNCYSDAKVTIRGAVETPHYILGSTDPEYFDTYLKDSPGVVAVLDTENGQLIGPTGEMGTNRYMRRSNRDEIDKLAMLWHSFFSVNESFTGGTYNRYNKVMFDWHVPAGAAVALGGWTYACPTGWYDGAMNYRGLLASGTWGILHEVGHNHGSVYGSVWGFGEGKEGEVRNNCLTVLSYIQFCDVGTTVRMGGGAEHGGYANPYNTLRETLGLKGKYSDYSDGGYGYFQCVGMYSNLMHSFGADKYYELLYSYKTNPKYCENPDNSSDPLYKRADFAYRCSLVYGMNFRKYFNEFYAANIKDEMYSDEQLAFMNSLPDYQPIACYYAGTIDGVKTAGDYLVTFGEDVTFDLMSNTISTLDGAENKGFEIISVSQPEHGTIRPLGDGKWAYSFNKEYNGALDEFSFSVKLSDGVVHKFTVTLRISYNGARLSVYDGITEKNWDDVDLLIINGTAQVFGVSSSNIPNYNSGTDYQVRVSEYYWKSPYDGEVKISAESDDLLRVYFGETFDEAEMILQFDTYTTGYTDGRSATVRLEKDKYYAVRLVNLNTGGGGFGRIAVKPQESESYSSIALNQIYHPYYPIGKTAETYVFEPVFLVSKKDNIKISNSGTDKSEWKVLLAPDDPHVNDGRFYETVLVDNETGKPIEGGTVTSDKWNWLIDGLAGTIFHTSWRNTATEKIKPPTAENPDVFVIDTAREQSFNYFTVTTRHTQNDDARITDYTLYVSSDNLQFTKVCDSSDAPLQYSVSSGSKVAALRFDSVVGRYWKLEVKGTSGKNYTIISELDAGVTSATQKVVPSTSKSFFTTSGWTDSKKIDTENSGYMIANAANEKMVIKFVGESFALYAATGENHGTADVYVDGKKYQSINTKSNKTELRKLVFNAENLENKEHTVEIITSSSDKFMVNIVGIPYTANLLNASNIYLERALAISLTVFVVLFLIAAAVILTVLLVPKFRNKVLNSKALEKFDQRQAEKKAIKDKAKNSPKQGQDENVKSKTKKDSAKKEKADSDSSVKKSSGK